MGWRSSYKSIGEENRTAKRIRNVKTQDRRRDKHRSRGERKTLSLILRIALGVGTARQAADRLAAVCFWFLWLVETARRDHQHPTCLTWLPQSLPSFTVMPALNPALSTDC
jgi:hypothetical protein